MSSDLTIYRSATEIRRELPELESQHDYQKKVAALQAYFKDPELRIADLEVQATMAATVKAMRADKRLALHGRPLKANKVATLATFLGVSPVVAHHAEQHWVKVAAVPEKDRAKFYASVTLPSRAALLRWSVQNGDETKEIRNTDLESYLDEGGKFATIYADPPWAYGNQATRASTGNHYGTLSIEAICDFKVFGRPIDEIVENAAHLHLWTTNAFLFESKHVIEAWGFEYKSCLVWVKPQMGLGNYWRVSHEFLMLGVRGGLRFAVKDQMSWIKAARTKHSRKPEAVRSAIEKVGGPQRMELFARQACPGWFSHGNEVEPVLYK